MLHLPFTLLVSFLTESNSPLPGSSPPNWFTDGPMLLFRHFMLPLIGSSA
jgi:hypothetical protein